MAELDSDALEQLRATLAASLGYPLKDVILKAGTSSPYFLARGVVYLVEADGSQLTTPEGPVEPMDLDDFPPDFFRFP